MGSVKVLQILLKRRIYEIFRTFTEKDFIFARAKYDYFMNETHEKKDRALKLNNSSG